MSQRSPLESHEAIADALLNLASMNDRASRTLERLETHVVDLRERIERHLTHKRKTPSLRVRDAHVRAIATMGGLCPFCDDSLFDTDSRFKGVVHHVDRASDATIEATMPTCGPCNQRFNVQPAPRAIVDAYHLRRERLVPSLFARGRSR